MPEYDGEALPGHVHTALCDIAWPPSLAPGALIAVQAPWFQGFEFCRRLDEASFFVQHNNGRSYAFP